VKSECSFVESVEEGSGFKSDVLPMMVMMTLVLIQKAETQFLAPEAKRYFEMYSHAYLTDTPRPHQQRFISNNTSACL
jgi:hypothetical protein